MLWWEESGFGLIISLKTHEKKAILCYFCLFSAIELLYRTRLRAPHVNVNLSSLFEGNCIDLRREGVSFRINIQSHTHEKKDFSGYFRLIFGFKTDLSDQTPSPKCQSRCIFLVWRPLNYALMGAWWEESGFGLIFSLTLTKKGLFSHLLFWLFWLIFGYRTSLPNKTPSPTCQTRCI